MVSYLDAWPINRMLSSAFTCQVNVFKRSIAYFRDNSLGKAVAKAYAEQLKFLMESVILEEITGRR